jgi:hypothetical protein
VLRRLIRFAHYARNEGLIWFVEFAFESSFQVTRVPSGKLGWRDGTGQTASRGSGGVGTLEADAAMRLRIEGLHLRWNSDPKVLLPHTVVADGPDADLG